MTSAATASDSQTPRAAIRVGLTTRRLPTLAAGTTIVWLAGDDTGAATGGAIPGAGEPAL